LRQRGPFGLGLDKAGGNGYYHRVCPVNGYRLKPIALGAKGSREKQWVFITPLDPLNTRTLLVPSSN
jgi:hypothetical protein